MNKDETFRLRPIGTIHSPYKTRGEAPWQGSMSNRVSEIEVFKEYEEGLKDIEGFSHLIILYLFHESKEYSLIQTTPWEFASHGVFATRSPDRPNPIGFSVVDLIERKGNILKVRKLDATDNTPLIDIKPYISKFDRRDISKSGWLDNIKS